MAATCIIICPGPSMNGATEEKLAGKTVICVSGAGPLRNYRCDWWVIGSFWSDASLVIPAGVKVCANGAIMNGRDGITTVALRAIAKCHLNYTLAGDALRLAWHLGHRDVEVWGADWRGKSLQRWIRESTEWWDTVRGLGLRVTRNGEVMREVPVCFFYVSPKERGVDDRRLRDVRIGELKRELLPCAIRGDGGFCAATGADAMAVHEAVSQARAAGRLNAATNELRTMYEIPE